MQIRWFTMVLVLLLLSQPMAASDEAWGPPLPGALVEGERLPPPILSTLAQGPLSPDGQWRLAWVTSSGRMPMLWVAASDLRAARFIADVDTYGEWLWSPHSTLLYWRRADDSWQEADPQTGNQAPFLPAVLTGKMAGLLSFSSDGQRLLYTTGLCRCNRGAGRPLAVYVASVSGMDARLLGIGVKARWRDDEILIER